MNILITLERGLSEIIRTEESFFKSKCSDTQTCMRILPSNTVTDLGNCFYVIKSEYWYNDAYYIYFELSCFILFSNISVQ